MIAGLARCLLGLALLPACWAFSRTLLDAIVAAGGAAGGMSVEAMSLLAGMAAFALCWATISHPVRMYVLGHELTHALWGLFFGARPSDVRVSESGGSVKLTKSNVFITLAPYFFPFYTFIVVVVALITSTFVHPLPFLPLWMFLIGFTWAFHILFTLETLTQRQPDVKLYGRVFSWVFIFLVNVALVLVWLAATTPLSFARLGSILLGHSTDAYLAVWTLSLRAARWAHSRTIGAEDVP